MTWEKEIVRADLMWVLLRRAGVSIEKHGAYWQWAITRQSTGAEPGTTEPTLPPRRIWHGSFDTPDGALQDALYALTAQYQEAL